MLKSFFSLSFSKLPGISSVDFIVVVSSSLNLFRCEGSELTLCAVPVSLHEKDFFVVVQALSTCQNC